MSSQHVKSQGFFVVEKKSSGWCTSCCSWSKHDNTAYNMTRNLRTSYNLIQHRSLNFQSCRKVSAGLSVCDKSALPSALGMQVGESSKLSSKAFAVAALYADSHCYCCSFFLLLFKHFSTLHLWFATVLPVSCDANALSIVARWSMQSQNSKSQVKDLSAPMDTRTTRTFSWPRTWPGCSHRHRTS